MIWVFESSLQWRHNRRQRVSNHQQLDGLFNYLLSPTPKKHQNSALLVLCEGNSPATGEYSAQGVSNTEKASILWRQHDIGSKVLHAESAAVLKYICRSTGMALKVINSIIKFRINIVLFGPFIIAVLM